MVEKGGKFGEKIHPTSLANLSIGKNKPLSSAGDPAMSHPWILQPWGLPLSSILYLSPIFFLSFILFSHHTAIIHCTMNLPLFYHYFYIYIRVLGH